MGNSQYKLNENLFQSRTIYFLGILVLLTSFFSCKQEDLIIPYVEEGELELTISGENFVLNQIDESKTIDFSWTTGSNKGTGASIVYLLEIDKKGNNFTNALVKNMGKGLYSKSYTYSELNESIVYKWEGIPGEEMILESRIIAIINSEDELSDTSSILEITVTPYRHIHKELYIIGSATDVGLDIANAIQLTPDSQDPTVFVFQGTLGAGTFMFPVNRDVGFSQDIYMKVAEDTTKIYLHKGGDSDDSQWSIAYEGIYTITINLIELSIVIEKVSDPLTEELYIIGSATEVGWDIANSIELTPDSQDPTIFVFQGRLGLGSFKFPVNRNTDFGQDMYMKVIEDTTKIYLHKGGDPDDNQWNIGEVGIYTITVNILELNIDIVKDSDLPPFDNIYIVGDGSTSGWNIDSPEAFTQDATDPFIFTYNGVLTQGSIKFLAGATGDWCGEWYRPLNNGESLTSTEVEQNSGCDVDNTWVVTVGDVGFYTITLDTRDVTVKFEKTELYMIGDAGPNGWNIGTLIAMDISTEVIMFTQDL